MNKNLLIGKFWTPDATVSALIKLRDKGVQIYDVFSPFPMHEIEPYLDIKRTRLTVAAFIYGALGLATAMLLMGLVFGVIWPMNIGGKPFLPYPAFVPIAFELTVLFSAHGMVFTFFIVANYWPGKTARLLDIRQTDDVLVVAVDKKKVDNSDEVFSIMNECGAFEVEEINWDANYTPVIHPYNPEG